MGFMRKALFVGTGGASGAVGIKANSKKERIAKASERELALERDARDEQERAEREREIDAGAWWLEEGAFKGLGGQIPGVYYLGGYLRHPIADRKKCHLQMSRDGLVVASAFKEHLRIPWPEVTAISITASEELSSEVASIAAIENKSKPHVLVTVRTRSEEKVRLLVLAKPASLEARLAPVTGRLEATSRLRATAARASFSVADELVKLARLRDSGVLTEEEFAIQKAKLLN